MAGEITIDDLRARIRSPEVAAAFDFIQDAISSAPGLSCEPERHGYMSSLRIRRGGEWSFSVSPAANWLLFYIRGPELRRGRIATAEVKSLFPQASERRSGEITIRLRESDSARRLMALILRRI